MSLRVSTSRPLSSACSGLMYSGVPTNCAKRGVERLVGELLADGLGDAEVDDLGHRHAVVQRHQDVGGLQVAVDDPFWWACCTAWQTLDEQLQPLPRA